MVTECGDSECGGRECGDSECGGRECGDSECGGRECNDSEYESALESAITSEARIVSVTSE